MTITVLEPEITIEPEWRNPTLPEVERGAAWLDENRPGWWQEIDTEYLNLRDCELCISGQLHLDACFYEPDDDGLDDPTSFPSYLGMDERQDEGGPSFAELQVAWEHEIARRRELA